ncbi:MT-A70 family methyltransferase [Cereibacter sphaeroides]|uniref:MT-A70 family methyltransferase n=1 Tax=Cereibacter sphaeroides TaxID=1063 RepID=UPI0000664039|nr:MT-A70 family protein [Cereibacter sphaeroides ATCC 17029]
MTALPVYDQWLELRPVGGFDLLMIDPPWSFGLRSSRGEAKSPHAHYRCSPLEWIKALPVHVLAAPDSLCWLWATNPMLPQALEALAAWGFQFKTGGHWVKRTRHGKLAFGTGYILRCAGEPFLIGTRGRVRTARNVRSVIEGPLREHSRKPDEAFLEAERLMPGARRIEVFSRQSRPGWTVWGDEVERFAPALAEPEAGCAL